MSEHDLFAMESIPEFAMQPAREDDTADFDPELYERLLAGLELFEPESAPEAIAAPAPEATAAPAPEAPAAPAPEPVRVEEAANPAVAVESRVEPTPVIRGEVIPVGEGVMVDRLQLVEMMPCDPVMILVEEDILVPDVKPDLESILSMDGALQFTERDGNIRGELILQTLYVPQGKGADRPVIDMESRVDFRQEVAREGDSSLERKADARIESLEHSVINERKYRVKAVIAVEGRRYRRRELELFKGLEGDEVQLLQETMAVTDVALRKNEPLELEEDLPLPDSLAEPAKILRCDVTLVENHKQINRDKAVISGTAYYTILYLPKEESASGEPVLFQSKSEFTQFVTLGRRSETEQNRSLSSGGSAGRAFFRVQKATAEPKESDSGIRNSIHVKVEGDTFLELYREVERQVVTDAYHHQKELVFDTETVELMQLCPCGIGEITVREVLGIPEQFSGVKTVSFLSGRVKAVKSRVEGGKNVTEGQVEAHLVCLSDDETPTPFDMIRQIPFRVSMDLAATASPSAGPAAAPLPDNETILKELRFDRLNDRQIEIHATVQVNGAVIRKMQCPLIRNVGFVEETASQQERPGLVLYISRRGDTLWKIARKYRTTIDAVAKINQIETGATLEAGTKLLIVK